MTPEEVEEAAMALFSAEITGRQIGLLSCTIVAGLPATPIRRRLPEALAHRMIARAWWDWHHARLRAVLDDFQTLEAQAFLDRHGR